MATLEELEARLDALAEEVDNIRQCSCDPSKYASSVSLAKAVNRIEDIESALSKIKSCTCDPSKYASAEDFAKVQDSMQALEDVVGSLVNAPEYKLPMTAAELVEKLGKIE